MGFLLFFGDISTNKQTQVTASFPNAQYDLVKRVDAASLPSAARLQKYEDGTSGGRYTVVEVVFSKYLQAGTWYWAVYNSAAAKLDFQVTTSASGKNKILSFSVPETTSRRDVYTFATAAAAAAVSFVESRLLLR